MSHLGSHSCPLTRCIYRNDESKSRFLSRSFNKSEGWVWSQWVSSEVVSVTEVHSGPGGAKRQPRVSTAANPAGGGVSRGHEVLGQPPQRAPRCPLGPCVSPTGSLEACWAGLSAAVCAPEGVCGQGSRGCCVRPPAQRFHSFPTSGLCALTCFPSSPSLVFYLVFSSLSLKPRVQRINIPWLESRILKPRLRALVAPPSSYGSSAGQRDCQISRGVSESACERSEWSRPGPVSWAPVVSPCVGGREMEWGVGVSVCLSSAG